MIPRIPRAASFEGCLLGLAVGDALGMPVAFLGASEIAERHGNLKDYRGSPGLRLRPGHWTDETELALLTVESLLEKGAVIAPDLAGRFAAWFARGRTRGLGAVTARVLSRIVAGAPIRAAAKSGDHAAGNGPAGRAAPLGLFACLRPERLPDWCREAASVTHDHPEATAGALAVASAVADAAVGLLDPTALLDRTAALVGPGRVADGLREAADLLRDPSVPPAEGIGRLGTGTFAWQSVPAALFAFCSAPRNFEASVLLAVQAGGHTDAVASMTGALSGAHNGSGAIPPRFARGLEDGQRIRTAAERLFRAVAASG